MSELLANLPMALPEILVLSTAVLALLADLFLQKSCRNLSFTITCFGLLAAMVAAYSLIGVKPSLLFNGLFIADSQAGIMKILIAGACLLCFFYARSYLEARLMPAGDYYALGLFSCLGMMVLSSTHSMLSLYLGLELMTLPIYAMVALQRSNAQAAEASIKYFVMGAIASGMLLYGISLVYGLTGQIDLLSIAQHIQSQSLVNSGMLLFALVLILAAAGFKLSAIPFHMWAPDVYAGAPTAVTLFISAAPKIAALGMSLRLLTIAFPALQMEWQQILLTLALLSTGLGNLFAVVQNNIKRLFAYSAISHMGYALFGLLAGTPFGYAAALYYIAIYVIMTAAAFGFLTLLSRKGLDIEHLDQLKGLNRNRPWLAFMMMIVLFSMAGVPPTVGFFAKFLVLKALVDAQMLWVAVLGLAFAVIGAFYYLRVVKVMYFDTQDEQIEIEISSAEQLVLSINCLALIYLGLVPAGLMQICQSAFS